MLHGYHNNLNVQTENQKHKFQIFYRILDSSPIDIGGIEVAFCVPKPCTTDEWITSMFLNVSIFGFEYEELIVRLPNDKPWVPVDYVAM